MKAPRVTPVFDTLCEREGAHTYCFAIRGYCTAAGITPINAHLMHRRLQMETGAELDALMPAVLDRVFKGEL